jgi:hypothetical protein
VRGLWAATPCDVDHSPMLARLRTSVGSTADVYWYRAWLWAMRYRQRGIIGEGDWAVMADEIRWPDGPGELRREFEAAGIVAPGGEMAGWRVYNGWILAKYEVDRKRHRNKVKAGRASGAARRRRRSGGG